MDPTQSGAFLAELKRQGNLTSGGETAPPGDLAADSAAEIVERSSPAPRDPASAGVSTAFAAHQNPRESWYVGLYHAFILALIILYYGLVVVLGSVLWIYLVMGATDVLSKVGGLQGLPRLILEVGGMVIVGLLLINLLLRVGTGLVQIVTGSVEDAPEFHEGVPLAPHEYPLLRSVVGEVAHRVEAPAPDEVRVTPHANCFAYETREFGVRSNRQLVLVLGLPHLAVLSASELKVILAHEFAHFQRDTAIGVFIYRFIKSLEHSTATAVARRWRFINPLHWMTKLFCHMFRNFTAPLQRYQELQADRWSAAAYGSNVAVQTLLKEWLIGGLYEASMAACRDDSAPCGGASVALSDFQIQWRELRPSPEGLKYLRERLAKEESTPAAAWATHPSTAARLRAMEEFPPVEAVAEFPARDLLAGDFAKLEMQLFPDARLPEPPKSQAEFDTVPEI